MVDNSPDPRSEPDHWAIRDQLDRVLASKPFNQSRRRQRFLKFIVDEALAGRGERLKSYTLATQVFDRPETFDAAIDPIVRMEAGRLREKLREYYATEGTSDPIRIEIPKGGYAPEFHQVVGPGDPTLQGAGAVAQPSIVVLPFVNMSADSAYDYLSDGVTENIITGLSRFRDLSVIASHSAFAYKGRTCKIQDIATDLGVRYVLEGSVRKSGDAFAITAQLIDGSTGAHLWVERFDRAAHDIAAGLEEVTSMIVARLAVAWGGRLHKAWRGRTEKGSPQNFRAYDYFQRGLDVFATFAPGCTDKARECFLKAVAIDPGYGKPYAKMAWSHLTDIMLGWTDDADRAMAQALDYATLAISRDDDEAYGYWAMGGYHIYSGQNARAIAAYERALEVNPNDADIINDYAWVLSYAGRADEGVASMLKAMQLNPHYPEWWAFVHGPVYFDARQYENAVSALENLRSIRTIGTELYLAASHAALGQLEAARNAIAKVLIFDPQASARSIAPGILDPYSRDADREHLRSNLLKAGLRE